MQKGPEVDIEKLAMLSRIQLTEEEKAAFSDQLADILGFFQKLQEADAGRHTRHTMGAGPLAEKRPGQPERPGCRP